MSKLPLTKHTLNLREGDFAYLESAYRDKGTPTSHVIRVLVSKHVDRMRAAEFAPLPEVQTDV